MISFTSLFSFWYTLAKDQIYCDKKIVKEICNELCQSRDLKLDIYSGDQPVISMGGGKNIINIELLFSPDISQALIDDRYPGAEHISFSSNPEDAFGFWPEIMLHLFMECGLNFQEDLSILNKNFSELSHTETLAANSIRILEKNEIIKFLSQHNLPLPAKIFPDHQPNSASIYKELTATKGWQVLYTLSDIRQILNFASHEKQEKEIVDQAEDLSNEAPAKMVIDGNNVIFTFMGKTVSARKKQGHVFLKYLFERPNQGIDSRDLYTLLGKQKYTNISTVEDVGEEASFDTASPKVRDDILKRIRMLQAKIVKAKQNDQPDLAEKYENEIKKLNKYLRDNFDSFGKPRKQRPPNENRCRKNVCESIKNCIEEFILKNECYHQALYDHLSKNGALKYGYTLRYNSPPGVKWETHP